MPNQNCLGHMNRWLAHERYRPLAIARDGFVDPFGITRAPMTIEPTDPASMALVRSLLAELLPLFTSRRVHVGLDEAWELPRERMGDFIAWVSALRALPELDGREMLMWGDMVAGDPDVLASLPPGVTICEWGYDDWHPVRRPLCRVGRRRRPLLGGTGDLELAEHPRPADERPHQLPQRGGGGRHPRGDRIPHHRLGGPGAPPAADHQRARAGLRRGGVVVPGRPTPTSTSRGP